MSALITCTPAKIVVNATYPFFSFGAINSETYREIKGIEGDECEVYERIDQYSVFLTDQQRNERIANGETPEQIAEQEKSFASYPEQFIGKDGTCLVENDFFIKKYTQENQNIASLTNTSGGAVSLSTDLNAVIGCEGPLYDLQAKKEWNDIK